MSFDFDPKFRRAPDEGSAPLTPSTASLLASCARVWRDRVGVPFRPLTLDDAPLEKQMIGGSMLTNMHTRGRLLCWMPRTLALRTTRNVLNLASDAAATDFVIDMISELTRMTAEFAGLLDPCGHYEAPRLEIHGGSFGTGVELITCASFVCDGSPAHALYYERR